MMFLVILCVTVCFSFTSKHIYFGLTRVRTDNIPGSTGLKLYVCLDCEAEEATICLPWMLTLPLRNITEPELLFSPHKSDCQQSIIVSIFRVAGLFLRPS